ncbi:MAG: PAS domain S-box protein [Candidatus Marinimicrobia bacterium]|nr:PAS domain S-box protein [Candidatus Neomarinimicrobiota bacterium]
MDKTGRVMEVLKSFFSFSVKRAIIFMLIVPTFASSLILFSFLFYLNETKSDVPFVNIAGQQRLISEQLGSYARMVHELGQEEDREPMRILIDKFDKSLAIIHNGGELEERWIKPAPTMVQSEIEEANKLWSKLKPSLLLIADRPADEPQTEAAYIYVMENIPILRDISNKVVSSYAVDSANQKNQILRVIITVIAFNFLLLIVALLLLKRYITKQKQETLALREAEEKYRSIIESAPDGIIIINQKGKIVQINTQTEILFGYTRDELVGQQLEILIPPRFKKHVELRKEFSKNPKTQTMGSGLEMYGLRKDGTEFPIDARMSSFDVDEDTMTSVTIRDMTVIKKAEKALRKEEELNRLVLNNVDEIIYMISFEEGNHFAGEIKYVSQRSMNITGYNYNEFIDNSNLWFDIVHPDDKPALISKTAEIISSGESGVREYRLKHKNGEYRWLSDHVVAQKNDGRVVGLFGVAGDITEKRESENQLRKLSSAITHSPSIVIIVDDSGNIEYVNPKFTVITGYGLKEVKGQNPRMLQSGNLSKSGYRELWETISAGREWRGEFKNKKKNGELFWVSSSISSIKNLAGEITHYLAVQEDITESIKARQDLETSLAETKRANNVKDQFIANISHELRTPLNSILGFSEIIENEFKEMINDENRIYFDSIQRSGNRLTRTVHDILEISQYEAGTYNGSFSNVDLVQIVNNILQEQEIQAKEKNLSLEFESDQKSAYVTVDEYSLSQALMNLIDNAIKYTEKGGIHIKHDADKDHHILKIKDTGIGISQDYLSRIFEPYTQGSEGYSKRFQGLGLGMTLCKRYMEFNNVKCDIDSEIGQGTEITLHFERTNENENEA